MSTASLETKAHELLGQLGPSQLAVVVQLLEVMVDDDGDQLTDGDRRAVETSREYFRKGGEGLTFEQVVAESGLNDFSLMCPPRYEPPINALRSPF